MRGETDMFALGMFLAFCGSVINSLAYVLFKLQVENSEYNINYNYVGTLALMITGILDSYGLSFISVSSYNAFVGLSIVGGQVLSTIILGTKLKLSQWILIICIACTTFLMAFCGDTREQVESNILSKLDISFTDKWTVGYFLFVNIGGFSILYYMMHCDIPQNISPANALNFIGPFGCALMSSLSDMCVKIASTIVRCYFHELCVVKPYHCTAFPLLVTYALVSVYMMQITMGKLNITITIPMYFTLALLMPITSSFVLLKESPSTLSGYMFSIFLLIFLNLTFVLHSQSVEEQNQSEAIQKLHEKEERTLIFSDDLTKIQTLPQIKATSITPEYKIRTNVC